MADARKVVIVTGASQGIGAGIVKGYRAAGYAVVANSRSIQKSSDPGVLTVAGDIGESAVAESLAQTAIDHFGRIDTLVNNAGIFIGKPFTQFTADDYRKVVHVNLDGFFHITQQVIPHMVAQKRGHIVQITTSMVDQPIAVAGAGLAALTKGGLDAVTRLLAVEYANDGIRANAVAPGIIKTPMHAPTTHDFLAGLHPVGRMGEVHEIVDAVLYLEKATFVTGVTLYVDGGQHAGRSWTPEKATR
jgi:NAD(P)-dependent dehydrogenase (short-subunit alcohol dehydrogenase family)